MCSSFRKFCSELCRSSFVRNQLTLVEFLHISAPGILQFIPFSLADPLELCHIGWEVSVNCYLQVSTQMFYGVKRLKAWSSGAGCLQWLPCIWLDWIILQFWPLSPSLLLTFYSVVAFVTLPKRSDWLLLRCSPFCHIVPSEDFWSSVRLVVGFLITLLTRVFVSSYSFELDAQL